MKSSVRQVTATQVHFLPSRRILAATTSHWLRRMGCACSSVTISSSTVVSTLKPFASSLCAFTGESSIPLAYLHRWCPAFSPRSLWISLSSLCASSPIVLMPDCISFFSEAAPRDRRSRTGRGHIFSGISSGNRVCTLSGFSKSEAIFASSLLTDMPIFTVKPSSRRILSFISQAVATGSG